MKYPIGAFLAYSRSDNSVSASPPGSTWLELIGSDYLRRIGTPLALCHSLYHSLLHPPATPGPHTPSLALWSFLDLALNCFGTRHQRPANKSSGFPRGSDSKESACSMGDLGLVPGSGRSPGEGNGGLPTPVFLPGEFHGQRGLTGCSL